MEEFIAIVKESVARKGKLLVPTFAVGRAQVLSMLMAVMFRRQLVPRFPVFLDSPMAIEASRIYLRHQELFDDEMLEFLHEGSIMSDLSSLKATATADESKLINDVPGPCLILAGAGMCTAGRILHHFRNNLWKPETTVVIAGFQSEGPLGGCRWKAKEVRIFGEDRGEGAGPHAGRLQRTRRPDGFAEVVFRHVGFASPGRPDPR